MKLGKIIDNFKLTPEAYEKIISVDMKDLVDIWNHEKSKFATDRIEARYCNGEFLMKLGKIIDNAKLLHQSLVNEANATTSPRT